MPIQSPILSAIEATLGHDLYALGGLFDAIQDALRDGQIAVVDTALKGACVERMAPEVMICLLTYSFAANEWLSAYDGLYRRVERELAARDIEPVPELAGLEPRRVE
jgi:hypothetical protein